MAVRDREAFYLPKLVQFSCLKRFLTLSSNGCQSYPSEIKVRPLPSTLAETFYGWGDCGPQRSLAERETLPWNIDSENVDIQIGTYFHLLWCELTYRSQKHFLIKWRPQNPVGFYIRSGGHIASLCLSVCVCMAVQYPAIHSLVTRLFCIRLCTLIENCKRLSPSTCREVSSNSLL